MAIKKYMSKKGIKSYNDAIDKFLENDFIPQTKNSEYEYEGYRYEKIHIEPIDICLRNNEHKYKELFENNKIKDTNEISYEAISKLLKDAKIDISEEELLKCFALSRMPIIDELKYDGSKYIVVYIGCYCGYCEGT